MNEKGKLLPYKVLFLLEFVSIGVLLLVFLNYHYFQLDSVIIGALQELLTIPSMLGLIIAPGFGIINWVLSGILLNWSALFVVAIGAVSLFFLILSFQ